MKKLFRLAITCGGTGGHFNPGLSIAQELNASGGTAILLLGGKHADKQKKIAAEKGVTAYKISASLVKSLRFLPDLISGYCQSKKIFAEHKIQALLSMGSYTAIPPCIAAGLSRLPFFLHDGNARLGKSNLFMSRFARAFAFSFPSVNPEKVRCKAVLTGFPLRRDLLDSVWTHETAIAEINRLFSAGFRPDKPVLLVFGGSLGAEKINANIDFSSGDLQVIHLAGPGKLETVKKCYQGKKNPLLLLESFQNMDLLYNAADFVISRAGGSTVSELAYFGKYALLIPYPFAAEHHQDDNAAWLCSAGGAEILPDSGCTKANFSAIIDRWTETHPDGKTNRRLAMPAAAENVLKMIENSLD